jgi:hypothetical protein
MDHGRQRPVARERLSAFVDHAQLTAIPKTPGVAQIPR